MSNDNIQEIILKKLDQLSLDLKETRENLRGDLQDTKKELNNISVHMGKLEQNIYNEKDRVNELFKKYENQNNKISLFHQKISLLENTVNKIESIDEKTEKKIDNISEKINSIEPEVKTNKRIKWAAFSAILAVTAKIIYDIFTK